MYEFNEMPRLTMAATILLAAHAVFGLLGSGATWMAGPAGPEEFRSAEMLQLVDFALLIVCFFVVGRWIYRASVNAHALTDQMTITPGWSVGWYFVPFANLVKPFHAMREIWQASHESDGSFEEKIPILGVWWGLWITTNILANVAWRMGELGIGPTIDLIASVLNVPLCIVLVMIMREIESSQRYVRHALAFA